MIDDGKMLNYIRQNVEMGIDGIDQISDHIHSREMNDVIMGQRQKYEDYFFKVDNMLKENGIAVVVVPGSILFGMTKMQIDQRKKLLDNKWLKAVIALPSCFYSSGVGVNLLIISKTNVENVLFINASNNGAITFTEKERKINVLTEEGIGIPVNLCSPLIISLHIVAVCQTGAHLQSHISQRR
mgnify:CR=1 FL=1